MVSVAVKKSPRISVPATNVIVEDYVPSGLTPVGFDPTAIQIPGTIPVGGSIEVELDFTITGDVTGEIVNVAEIIFAQDDLGNTPPDEDSTPDDIEGNDAEDLLIQQLMMLSMEMVQAHLDQAMLQLMRMIQIRRISQYLSLLQ